MVDFNIEDFNAWLNLTQLTSTHSLVLLYEIQKGQMTLRDPEGLKTACITLKHDLSPLYSRVL